MKRYALIILLSQFFFLGVIANHQNFDSLINVAQNSTVDTSKLNAYVEIATGMRYVYPDSAFYYTKLAEELAVKYKNYEKLGAVHNVYGAYYWVRGDMNKAIQSFHSAYDNYKNAGFNHKLGGVLLNIALGYNAMHEIDSVFHYIELSKDASLKFGDTTMYFSAVGLQIPIYTDQGNFEKAIELGLESLKQAKEAKDNLLLYYAYTNIGATYYKMGEYDKTEKYHLKALEYAIKRGNAMDESNASNNLGLLYSTIEDYDKAIKYYNRSRELNKTLQNPAQFIVSSVNMAIMYNNTKKFNTAIRVLTEALTKAKEIEANKFIPNIFLTRAYAFLGLDNLTKTEQNVNEAINWAHKTGKVKILTDSYQIKTSIDSTRGDYLNALRFKDSAQKYIDSIGNKDVRNRINELNVKYAAEEKELENALLKKNNEAKEIQISKQNIIINTSIIVGALFLILLLVIVISRLRLQKRNRLILQQSAALEQSLEEIQALSDFKNDMTQMLVHDLKNPLNALLNLPELDDFGEKSELLKYASQKMHNLVINILDVNKYENASLSISLEKIRVANVWKQILYQYDYIIREKNIDVSYEIITDFEIIADKNLFERIISNLLSNAINNTKRNGKVIFKAHQKSDFSYYFEIADNGYGIAKDKLETIFDQYNQGDSKVAYSTGIGLAFCKQAIEAQGGTIAIDSMVDKGTTVSFELPHNSRKKLESVVPEKISLSREDKKKLLPFYEPLSTIGPNETSRFRRIYLDLESLELSSLDWLKKVKNTFYKTDQEKYTNLIDRIIKD